MLFSVLPWEWILENVLDLKEFSLPCLKELISYIPHIEDPRCSKLLQKVALRHLEEIVVTRKVNPCSIALIKYILKPQGVSNLCRIHSLKESVQNDLILRVETEVVLATVRHQGRNGGRNWKVFEDAVEEVFPGSTQETGKAERRKELISILSVSEQQDDLYEQLLRKYPLEDLLKDLLQFIESKKKQLKTKFLDQLAKDVLSGSYIPSSASRFPEKGISTRMNVSEDSHGNIEVPEILLPPEKEVLPYSTQREPTLPKTLLGEPVENFAKAMKEPSAGVHIYRSSPSSPVNRVDDGQATLHEAKELRDLRLPKKKTPRVDKVSVREDIRIDMSPNFMEVDKVSRELTSQMNDFVDNMDKFAADFHKVAVNSTEQAYALVNTVVAQEEQRVDRVSFGADHDLAVKRSASGQLPGSTEKTQGGSLNDSPGRGRDGDGRSPGKAVLSTQNDVKPGHLVHENDLNISRDCSVSGDGQRILTETSLYKCFKAFLQQSTQDQHVSKPTASMLPVLKCVSRAHDTGCALCQRGGVLLSCHGCSVAVHERCLGELSMGKTVNEPYWLCPSCVEQLTLGVLEKVKAEADTARQKAAAFGLARSKQSTERRSAGEIGDGPDKITISLGACGVPQEHTKSKDGKEHSLGLKRGTKSSSLDEKEASKGRERKKREGSFSQSQHGFKRYCLRPRIHAETLKEHDLIPDEAQNSPTAKPTTGVDGPETVTCPSSTGAVSYPAKSMSKVVTAETAQSAPVVEEIAGTNIQSRECVENDRQPSVAARNRSDEGQEAVNVGSGGSMQHVPQSRDLLPAKEPELNISKLGIEEGDRHDGDLEEDINRHQDGAECSRDNQTSDHPSPIVKGTPKKRGRYRGPWKIPGVRRRNLPWSEFEAAVLREGVKKYSSSGWGFQWKNILEFGYGKFDPSRTAGDLKDKWRNLNKFQGTSSGSDASS